MRQGKEALASPAVLKFPDPSKPYVLYTEASDQGLGAVLTQKDENDEERPICFVSRNIQGAELNYPRVEKELLAVVFANVVDCSFSPERRSRNMVGIRLWNNGPVCSQPYSSEALGVIS